MGDDEHFTIFLSYSKEDLTLISTDIEKLKNHGYNLTENLDDSSICIVFISPNSIKSGIKDMEKAFLNDLPLLLIYLEDVKFKFGLISKIKHRSKINKLEEHSINKYLLEDEIFGDRFITSIENIEVKQNKSGNLPFEIEDYHNFKYLESLIKESNEISFSADIILDDEEEEIFKDGIKIIRDNVIIDGNGFTINGKGKSRTFAVEGKNIVFKNINFINCHNFRGGAILCQNNALISLENCEFKNNNALQSGGAIFQEGGILKVLNCKFSNNKSMGMGGAIQIENGAIEIEDSEFNKSNAQFGGALRINFSKSIINKSIFKHNSSQYGGAINYNESEIKITASNFSNNIAKANGGAIETQNGSLNIQKTEFSNNSAKYGSAIRNHAQTFVKDCNFSYDSSDEGIIFNKKGSIELIDCNFDKNQSKKYLIYNEDYLNIISTSFKENDARNLVLNLFNSSLSNCDFLKNHSEFIFENQGKSSNLSNCYFENNNSERDILNEADLTLEKLGLIGNDKFILNKKNIFLKDNNEEIEEKIENLGNVEYLTRTDKNFDFTYLDEIIHNSSSAEISLNHDIALKNYERDFYEGGIEIDIDDLVINGNNHAIDGNGISRLFLINSSKVTLKNIILKNGHSHKNDYQNPLNNNGGAIRNNSKSSLECINCEFLLNSSEDKGGAIDNRGGNLTILNCKFNENSSDFNGGAIINRKNGKIYLRESSLNKNKTRLNGGAIENEGRITINDCVFSENISKYGGAIRNIEKLTIENSIFKNNYAKDGGSINNFKNGKTQISNSLFEANNADSGGAIENRGLELNMKNCEFVKNKSENNGGGIFSFFSEEFRVEYCIFKDNKANGDGGAIWNFSSNSNLRIISSSFNDNTPNDILERK